MLEQYNKDKNPFKVPENYFENFHATILEQVGVQPEMEIAAIRKKIPMWKKIVPWMAGAAVFAGVIFGTGILDETVTMRYNNSDTVQDEVNVDEYYSFLENELVGSEYEEYLYDEVQ